jgi:hypothetical protein
MSTTKIPISEKQLAANRANAKKSTGPTSPAGKARSSQNAIKHGFTASTFAVVRLEDLQEIAKLKVDLIAVYEPVNSQELFALERMALAQQAILRAARLEAGLFTVSMNDTMAANNRPFKPMTQDFIGDGDIEITRAQNRNFCMADGFAHQAHKSHIWTLFLRYQSQAERQYRRALEEFNRLKALRSELPTQEIPAQGPPQEDLLQELVPDEPIDPLQPEEESDLYPTPAMRPKAPATTPEPAPPHPSK